MTIDYEIIILLVVLVDVDSSNVSQSPGTTADSVMVSLKKPEDKEEELHDLLWNWIIKMRRRTISFIVPLGNCRLKACNIFLQIQSYEKYGSWGRPGSSLFFPAQAEPRPLNFWAERASGYQIYQIKTNSSLRCYMFLECMCWFEKSHCCMMLFFQKWVSLKTSCYTTCMQ